MTSDPMREALQNAAGLLDTPIARRKYANDPFYAEVVASIRVALSAPAPVGEPVAWHDGAPPKPWADEWFIAETICHERVVLRSLPEEYTYDFKTADETYIKAANIKRWMPFPDSEYIEPTTQPSAFRAIQKAYDAGWLTYHDHKQHDHDPQYAREGDRPEYRSIEDRARAAESELSTLRARVREVVGQMVDLTEDFKVYGPAVVAARQLMEELK